MPDPGCAFCAPRIPQLALWESEHYRVFADEYPRCVGHVLLVSKEHVIGHMDAPIEWLPELEAAQAHVRRFLLDTFGAAGFWEHGGSVKEVPHAHLHGLPADVAFGQDWIDRGQVRLVNGWRDVRHHHASTGEYVYTGGNGGAYLVLDEPGVLVEVRRLTVVQAGGALEPGGGLRRGGPDMVERTRELWRRWAAQ